MQIKEHLKYTKYLFTSPLYIDDNMNVTLDTKEYDKFRLLMDKHGITNYDQSRIVDGKAEVVVSISILNELKTQAFEYDFLTMLMECKQ
tara:strand:+ start:374 stop:640 length:267 start_codon:yes stop_codon:yes gene_type:complete